MPINEDKFTYKKNWRSWPLVRHLRAFQFRRMKPFGNGRSDNLSVIRYLLKNSEYRNIIEPLLNLYFGEKISWHEYSTKMSSNILNYCENYSLPIRMKRWIPKDYRKWNYKISELLLNKYYHDSLKGNPDKSMLWAGLRLNDLKESILEVYKRGELLKVNSFNMKIINFIEPYMKKSRNFNQKTGLDKFL